jgi:hypothetical protein
LRRRINPHLSRRSPASAGRRRVAILDPVFYFLLSNFYF